MLALAVPMGETMAVTISSATSTNFSWSLVGTGQHDLSHSGQPILRIQRHSRWSALSLCSLDSDALHLHG